jgi:hypothetical protein
VTHGFTADHLTYQQVGLERSFLSDQADGRVITRCITPFVADQAVDLGVQRPPLT